MAKNFLLLGVAMIGLAATNAQAADVLNPGTGVPIALASSIYTQDFNSLKSVTSDPTPPNALPSGWQAFESGTAADGNYQFGSASSNTAGVWSYGSGSDRALGGHASTSVSTIRFGAIFENDLGGTIDGITISFTGEQWQKGFNRATLRFEYSLDATNINDGSWTSFSDLDFLAPDATSFGGSQFGIGSRNGNSAAFRTQLSDRISGLAIGAGDSFGLRWTLTDIDTAGVTSDDGLAIDDLRLNASVAAAAAVPEPATWAMMIGGFGLVGGVMRRRQPTGARLA